MSVPNQHRLTLHAHAHGPNRGVAPQNSGFDEESSETVVPSRGLAVPNLEVPLQNLNSAVPSLDAPVPTSDAGVQNSEGGVRKWGGYFRSTPPLPPMGF